MNLRQQRDQQYRKKLLSIQNFLQNNTGYDLAGVARAGSRKQGGWSIDCDLDIRFAIASDPARTIIYPDLKRKLKKSFPNSLVRIGASYNVLNIKIGDLDFDLVLLSVVKFERQVRRDKLKRLT